MFVTTVCFLFPSKVEMAEEQKYLWDLICICHPHKNNNICQLITLPKIEVVMIKVLDDGPPPKLFCGSTEEPCLNFLESNRFIRMTPNETYSVGTCFKQTPRIKRIVQHSPRVFALKTPWTVSSVCKFLVYTKPVNSCLCVLWLATQTRDIHSPQSEQNKTAFRFALFFKNTFA